MTSLHHDPSDALGERDGPAWETAGAEGMRPAARSGGDTDHVPEAVAHAVELVKGSPLAAVIGWGHPLVAHYNDAFARFVGLTAPLTEGAARPPALAACEAILRAALDNGRAELVPDVPCLRSVPSGDGRPGDGEGHHEAFATWAVTPVLGPGGTALAATATLFETTERVLAQRRLALLGSLATELRGLHGVEKVCETAAIVLRRARDFAFSLIYRIERDGSTRLLAKAGSGVVADPPADLTQAERWPLAEVVASGRCQNIAGEERPPTAAVLAPIAPPDADRPFAVLVAGLSPHVMAGSATTDLVRAVADEIAAAITRARVPEEAQNRSDELPAIGPATRASNDRVLLVDDDPKLLAELTEVLAPHFSVTSLGDGAEAMALIERDPPALVVSELTLPSLDGRELLARLRANPSTKQIPIIFLSGATGHEARGEILEAGADDHLRKPFSPAKLVARVRTHLELARLRVDADILQRINALLTAELDHGRLLQLLTDEATKLVGAQFGAYFHNVTDAHGESLLLYTLSGAPRSAFEGFPMPRNTAIFGPTFRGEGVVRSDDITQDPRYGRNAPNRGMPKGHLPVRSYLAVPVISRTGEVLGGLFFGHEAEGVFSARSERLALGVAGQGAIAIDNARLFEEAQRQKHEVRSLLEREQTARGELEASHRRQSEILQQIPAAVMIADAAGKIVFINQLASEFFGAQLLSPDSPADPRLAFPAWHDDGTAYAVEDYPLRRALHGEVVDGQELHFRRVDGRSAVVRATAAPIHDASGAIVSAVAAYHDVTEQKHLERQMRRSEERFRTLAEGTSQIVWTADARGLMREDSPSWRAFTGQSFEELSRGEALQALHPDDRTQVVALWERRLAAPGLLEVEGRLRRRDGVYVPMLLRAAPVRNEDGSVREWIGTLADITARRALLESERVARQEAEAARQRMALLDAITKELVGDLQGSSLGIERLTRLAVPELADVCTIYIRRDDGSIVPASTAHADDPAARAFSPSRVDPISADPSGVDSSRADPSSAFGIAEVIQSGKTQVLNRSQDRKPESSAAGVEPLALPQAAEVHANVAVALRGRGGIIGCLSLTHTFSRRRFSPDDVALAEEVAVRGAMTLDHAQLFREAQAARVAAEAANRAKDVFLAMLGHELRNPLSPILTALQLMKLRSADASKADGHAFEKERAVIERQVRHLVRLVDDLLDVSRITRGKIELHRQPVELGEVVAKAIEMASPLFEQRSHHLGVRVPRRGLVVNGDVGRLAQVLSNLFTNAAKYTQPGGHITISAAPEEDHAVLRVRDDGIGIAPTLLPHVFDLFAQGEQAIDRSQGGLGIGLTIVRSLIELHDGQVTASSEGLGKGSEFRVQLPLHHAVATADAAVAPDRWRSLPQSLGQGKRLLIVDDNHDAAILVAEALDAMGFVTRIAYDGPSALAIVAHFEPEVALLDIGLPVMDGYELATRLRERFPHLRLVAITGYGQETDRIRSRAAGFEDHLVKPLNLDGLTEILSHA